MSMIDDKTNPTLSQASPRPAQETQVCGIPKIRRVVFVFFFPPGLPQKIPMRSLQILEIPRKWSEFCV